MEEKAQRLIDQTTAAFKSGKLFKLPPPIPSIAPFPSSFSIPPPSSNNSIIIKDSKFLLITFYHLITNCYLYILNSITLF